MIFACRLSPPGVTTDLLEKALSEVKKLPPSEQDAVAAILLEELAAEQRWTESFAKSQDALKKLGQEALAEHRAGLTKPLQ
jgi:DNA topoisomerase VI subunit A